MSFYQRFAPEVISDEEMIARYGTNKPIPQLNIVDTEVAKRIVQAELKLLTE
jgi:hypothetical protein